MTLTRDVREQVAILNDIIEHFASNNILTPSVCKKITDNKYVYDYSGDVLTVTVLSANPISTMIRSLNLKVLNKFDDVILNVDDLVETVTRLCKLCPRMSVYVNDTYIKHTRVSAAYVTECCKTEIRKSIAYAYHSSGYLGRVHLNNICNEELSPILRYHLNRAEPIDTDQFKPGVKIEIGSIMYVRDHEYIRIRIEPAHKEPWF